MHSLITRIESTGEWAPWIFAGIFLAASFLTIWRLESMSAGGLEGTVLGTLVTPYMTGMGNLIFAYVMARGHRPATDVMTNCLVNNVSNMTVVLGLPAFVWGLNLQKKESAKKNTRPKGSVGVQQVNRLSLLLTLLAVIFFTGLTWFLGADGRIDFTDGVVLVGIFLFWQCFHVFDVLKNNARQNKSFSWMLPFDLAVFGLGACAIYVSTDWLVNWVSNIHSGFVSAKYLGLLSGWLNVLPNAVLAFYYAWTRRPEIVYTSQSGDNHICIPLCIGVFALFHAISVPSFFSVGLGLLLAATLLHFIFIAVIGRLPRTAGLGLTLAYGWFLYRVIYGGLLK